MKKFFVPVTVILVIALVLFLLNGRNSTTTSEAPSGVPAVMSGDIQIVTTKFSSNSYVPIVVRENVPVRWTIQMAEEDLNGCNNAIVIPKFGIEKKLTAGETVIEFTPSGSGSIPYSCWMGMIRSNITVINKNDSTSKATQNIDVAALNAENTTEREKEGPSCCSF